MFKFLMKNILTIIIFTLSMTIQAQSVENNQNSNIPSSQIFQETKNSLNESQTEQNNKTVVQHKNNVDNSFLPNATRVTNGFIWILVLAMIVGLFFCFYLFYKLSRKPEANHQNSSTFKDPQDKILDHKDELFRNFKKHSRPSMIENIRLYTTSEFFETIKDDVLDSSETKEVLIKTLDSELIDFTIENGVDIAIVLYNADIEENELIKSVSEVWSFKYIDKDWKLSSIENVIP